MVYFEKEKEIIISFFIFSKETFINFIKRDDGRVDLGVCADKIFKKYRAYHPWPGIWTILRIKNQELRVKLIDLELADGKLKINKLQPEGKKPMTMAEFERGYGPLTT